MKAAINLIRNQCHCPSSLFPCTLTHKNLPHSCQKKAILHASLSCPDSLQERVYCCDLVELAVERDKPSGNMALSCQRWGQECLQGFSLYSSWCYLGTYGRHQGIAIKKPNKCQSITSLRWNWSVNRTISVLWKSYSLEVCCGLIHACNKKWNSFVSTNYFFPVLVHNITFHGSHMECVCFQNSKTSATSCLSKTKFIVEIYICICVNYAR